MSCTHESDVYITLSPVSLEKEFVCRKCGIKKIAGSPIVPFWLADTAHYPNSDFKFYKPSESKEEKVKEKTKKHWWQ